MDGEYDLYGGTPPHQVTSATSEAAAETMTEEALTLRLRVYAFVVRRGSQGATDWEIQKALGMAVSTEVPRRRELVLKGLLKDGGFCRLTRTRRQATVWVRAEEPEQKVQGPLESLKQRYDKTLERLAKCEAELEECRAMLRRYQKEEPRRQMSLF